MAHTQPLLDTFFDCIDPRVSKVRVQRTLLCSDIVGYTSLLARLGDTAALPIIRRHDAIVRDCAAAHGGSVLELRGDGFLLSFVRREEALACAVEIQRGLAADRDAHEDGGVRVRIGIHTGELFAERGRLFGLEVVVPFRLLEHAGAEEILVSRRPASEDAAFAIRARLELALEGLPASVAVVAIDWRCGERLDLGAAHADEAFAAAC